MMMNTVPLQCKVFLANPHGLHMRPCSAFAELAERFESKVTVTCNGRSADGRSVWDLIGLMAEPGSELLIEVDGPDARQAIDALAGLLSTVPPPN